MSLLMPMEIRFRCVSIFARLTPEVSFPSVMVTKVPVATTAPSVAA
jgi:hypothetical protein